MKPYWKEKKKKRKQTNKKTHNNKKSLGLKYLQENWANYLTKVAF